MLCSIRIHNDNLQLTPKRLYPLCCEALLRFHDLASFVIIQRLLLEFIHFVVGSFLVVPLLHKSCAKSLAIPRFL